VHGVVFGDLQGQRVTPMPFPQTIFLGSAVFLTPPRKPLILEGTFMHPTGYAWFCPTCGDIWARAVVEGCSFQLIHMPCVLHPHPFPTREPAGSLYIFWDQLFLDTLPLALLHRELLLHLNHFEGV
jgi:hypothetical protein